MLSFHNDVFLPGEQVAPFLCHLHLNSKKIDYYQIIYSLNLHSLHCFPVVIVDTTEDHNGKLERQAENTLYLKNYRSQQQGSFTNTRCLQKNKHQAKGTCTRQVRSKNKTIVPNWLWPLINNNNNNNKIYPESVHIHVEGIIAIIRLIHAVVQQPMKLGSHLHVFLYMYSTFVRVSNWFSKVSNLDSNLSSWANVYTKNTNMIMIQGCTVQLTNMDAHLTCE